MSSVGNLTCCNQEGFIAMFYQKSRESFVFSRYSAIVLLAFLGIFAGLCGFIGWKLQAFALFCAL